MLARRSLIAVALLVTACDSGSTTTTDLATTTTATTAATTTTPAVTTTTATVAVDVLELPVAATQMGPEWVEVLFVPYGDTDDTLGTSRGGDAGSIDFGPEYGAQAPDGTWWFLDVAKTRLARYTATGDFIDGLTLPPEVLVSGIYVQFQLPRVMADGTFVAFGYRDDQTAILRATSAGVIDQVLLPGTLGARADDGELVFGFDGGGTAIAISPIAGTITPVEWFLTQTGARYRFSMTETGLRIELPDAPVPVDRIVPLVAASEPTAQAFGSIEVATTADGRIHLFIVGASEADESVQLAGYTTILPDGTVTAMVATQNPFTPSDPGSPAHLGAAFGAEQPWLMIVDTDGVHVYGPSSRE